MDLVIDAVARGEFDRGDEFNYYSSQNTTTFRSTHRRRRHNGTDDHQTELMFMSLEFVCVESV